MEKMGKLENVSYDVKKILELYIKPFCVIFFLYLVGVIAILRANFNYIDDMGRVALGYKSWEGFGRYLSNFLSRFIHADGYLTDISPLPQMIAIAILAVSSTILLYLFTEKNEYTFWQYISVIPLGLSPYFLECISYKYDSPYMAVSILASVVPLLFRKKTWTYWIACCIGTLMVCMTYQAACGIFPMLVIILTLKDWSKAKDTRGTFCFGLFSIAGYLTGMVIFKVFIMKTVDTYVSNALSISKFFVHLKRYYEIFWADFRKEWLILIVVLMVAFLVSLVRNSVRHWAWTFALAIAALILMCMVVVGVYPALEQPLYAPRAMYGFGALLTIMALEVTVTERIYWGKLMALGLSWAFFVFSFTYGNALYVQKEYTDYRITMIAEDLNELEVNTSGEMKEVQIEGTIGYAPAIRNMPKDYRMLRRLVPITLREKWQWGAFGFLNYYDLKNVQMNLADDFKKLDLDVLKETDLYTIKGDDTHILIVLTK